MRARIALLLLVAFFLIPQTLAAATIYLRDRTTIKCEITRETPETFEYKLEGYGYSFAYTHDEVKKADIFTIIDDKGVLRFPDDLTLKAMASPEGAMTEAEFQRRSLALQIAAEEKAASSLSSISTVLWLELALTVIGGVVNALVAQ